MGATLTEISEYLLACLCFVNLILSFFSDRKQPSLTRVSDVLSVDAVDETSKSMGFGGDLEEISGNFVTEEIQVCMHACWAVTDPIL